jgi:hypothetical protein
MEIRDKGQRYLTDIISINQTACDHPTLFRGGDTL